MLDIKPLSEIEDALTEEFGISEQQVQSVKEDIADVVTEMCEKHGIASDDDSITLIQRVSLYDVLYILQTTEWPPRDDSPLQSETPEEHFEQYCEEISDGGQAAYASISDTFGTLRGHVSRDSAVRKLTTKLVSNNLEQAKK